MTTYRIPQFSVPAWLAPYVAEVRAWSAISGPERRCDVAVCDRTAFSLGLCYSHYANLRARARRQGAAVADWVAEHRDEVVESAAVRAPESACWVGSCSRGAVLHGLCHAHHRLAKHHFYEQVGVGPASEHETGQDT